MVKFVCIRLLRGMCAASYMDIYKVNKFYKQTNITSILQGLDLCLIRNTYFLLHLHDNTVPMFMSLDLRDFNFSWPLIILPLFQPFIAGSDESGWDRVVGRPACCTLLLWRRSLAAHISCVFRCVLWIAVVRCGMELSVRHLMCFMILYTICI